MSDASLQHWREGVGAYNTGNVQRAIQEFKAAAPSKGVLFNLGVSTAKMGDNQSAIRHFDEVIQMDPNLGVAYLTRGACKHHERMYDAALKDYDQALGLVGNSTALDYSSEGLQFEMHKVDLLFNRALALKELARLPEAQADAALAKQLVDGKTMSRSAALDKLTSQLATLALAHASSSSSATDNFSNNSMPHQQQAPPPQYPEGVDPTKRETYLSDEEFQKVFGCGKDDFIAMPQWKRELLKKKKLLF